jgi:hypothetical protein
LASLSTVRDKQVIARMDKKSALKMWKFTLASFFRSRSVRRLRPGRLDIASASTGHAPARVHGVTGIRDIHVVPADERTRVFPRDQIYLDVGAKNEAEVLAMGISPGDPVLRRRLGGTSESAWWRSDCKSFQMIRIEIAEAAVDSCPTRTVPMAPG